MSTFANATRTLVSVYPENRLLDINLILKHVEHFKSVNIGNYTKILNTSPSFIGEWRVYYEFTTTRNMLLPIAVSEV